MNNTLLLNVLLRRGRGATVELAEQLNRPAQSVRRWSHFGYTVDSNRLIISDQGRIIARMPDDWCVK